MLKLRNATRIVLGLLLVAACSLDAPGDQASINLYVSVDKSTLPDGQVMTITLTARNVGYNALTLTGPSDCLLHVDILDGQGGIAWNSSTQCLGQVVTEDIEPGDDKVQSFQWAGVGLAGARLAPGFYHIRPVARLTGGAYIGPLLSVALE